VAYRFLDFELDAELYELRRAGEPVAVEAKSLDLLLYLVRHRERVVTREELLREVWPRLSVTGAALSQALYGARRAVDDDARRQQVVQTVRGRGLRFVAEVSEGRARRVRAAPGGLGPGAGSPPFVGRLEILGELEDGLDEATRGRGRLVLIGGEPGIGKSRLAEEFAERARKRGVLVHLGRCREEEGAPAYWPWLELLRAHARHVGPVRWRELLDAWPQIGQMAPELDPEGRAGAQPELEAGPARFRLFDGISQLWQSAAGEAPVLLVFDDLHRADTPSWLLLRFVARDIATARVLIVGTYRDTELRRDPARTASFAELAREANGQILALGGFTRVEVADFVALTTSRDVDARTVDDLLQRTAGNPFFLFHLAPLLVQAPDQKATAGQIGAAERIGGAATLTTMALPLTLREAIARQLEGLPEATRALLRLASVAGREFTLAVLSEASGEPVDAVLAELSPALVAGAVVDHAERVGHYRFAHLLVRDALYASLAPAERAALHLRIGEALELGAAGDPQAQLADLAHHFHAAVPVGGAERALDYTSRAGYAAAGRLAFEEAAPLFRQALELAERDTRAPERTCNLLIALGEAETRTGDRERARTTFTRAAELAKRLGAAEKLAETALTVMPGFLSIEGGVVDPFTVSLLEEALEALPEKASPLRARLLSRLAVALYWAHDADEKREALVEVARRMAAEVGDRVASVDVAVGEFIALWGPDNLERRLVLADEIVLAADELGMLEASLMGRISRIAALIEHADILHAEREVDAFSKLVDLRALPQAQWYPTLYRAVLALHRGELSLAEESAQEFARRGARLGDANVLHCLAAILAIVRWHQGRSVEILAEVASMADRFPNITAWRAALAFFSLSAGEESAATGTYERLIVNDAPVVRRDELWLLAMAQLAEVCAEIGDRARAPAFYHALRPYAGRLIPIGFAACIWAPVDRAVARVAGLMELWDESERFFESARSLELNTGARASLAYTLACRAKALLGRGQSRAARNAARWAEESLALAHGLGMHRLVRTLPALIERGRASS
jgi:DNA-binding winged helix-turn-helix (wHTH) protein